MSEPIEKPVQYQPSSYGLLGSKNGDSTSFSSIVENGQISVQWLDDQRGKTDLYCFSFAIIDLQQGKEKTLKNVAFVCL